ncbi:MAG: hypothetical protein RLY69_642 [Verrucomicrobiota bacterium]
MGRLAFIEGEPPANDSIDRPNPKDKKSDHPCGKAHEHEHQHERNQSNKACPCEGVPKSMDLPLEVGLKPGAACFGAFHIIDDDRNDRRPTEEKTSDH